MIRSPYRSRNQVRWRTQCRSQGKKHNAIDLIYLRIGLDSATGGDCVFKNLVAARIIHVRVKASVPFILPLLSNITVMCGSVGTPKSIDFPNILLNVAQ